MLIPQEVFDKLRALVLTFPEDQREAAAIYIGECVAAKCIADLREQDGILRRMLPPVPIDTDDVKSDVQL
jgi:hypothetical protein